MEGVHHELTKAPFPMIKAILLSYQSKTPI